MYGILGEDDSDVATLRVLVRKLKGDRSLRIPGKGFGGCAHLLRKGAAHLQLLQNLQCTRFIICHDADGPDPGPVRDRVRKQIIEPSGIRADFCIVVPVQELEAWILADIEAAAKIISSWRPNAISNPESICDPKGYLRRLSRDSRKRPLYDPPTHNEKIAEHLDTAKLSRKCPSFRQLAEFVA